MDMSLIIVDEATEEGNAEAEYYGEVTVEEENLAADWADEAFAALCQHPVQTCWFF
jgi:hypothetical protein